MTNKERKLSQRYSYHQAVRGRDKNKGHSPDHKFGRIYWAFLLNGVEIKCGVPQGRHQRRGF